VVFRSLCYPASVTKLAVWLLACLIALSAPAVRAAGGADAPYLFALSKLLLDEGDYREAEDALRRAVAGAPDDPYLRVDFAGFLLDSGQTEAGIGQLEAAVALAPGDPEILKAIGNLHLRAAREHEASFAAARDVFERLRKMTPGDLDVQSTLGRIYLSEQRYAEAADVFRQGLSYWPQSRALHGSLIDALLRAGAKDEAEASLVDFLRVAPDSIRARLTLADLRQSRGDREGSAAVLRDTPKQSEGEPELLGQLAVALYDRELFAEALYWLDRSLAESGDDDSAGQLLFLRAMLLTAVNRHEEARAVLTGMLESHPEREDALELLVRHLIAAGDWQGVAKLLEPRLVGDLDSAQSELALLYTEALRRLDRPQEALDWLARLAEDETLRPRALARRAEILLGLDRDAEADETLAALTAGGEAETLMLAAEACQREERYARSVPYLERLTAQQEPPLQAVFWLGAAYERTGQRSRAEDAFQRYLKAEPDSAPALNYLGYMWAEHGENLEEALQLVQRAVALDPDNGAYLDSLGWAYFQLGNYEEARAHLERAVELVGEDAVVLEHLGDLYSALGKTQQAVELYRRALAAAGDNADQVMTKLRQFESS
jgi:tetratricopeptide (TPR) repeat protein